MRRIESGQFVPKRSIFKSLTEAWAWAVRADLMLCTCPALCQPRCQRRRAHYHFRLPPIPAISSRPSSPQCQRLSFQSRWQAEETKSTGTVKILRGLPLAKCKYKNETTYSSSTNFIILLRQAVKFFFWFYFFFFIYTHNVSHSILYVYR